MQDKESTDSFIQNITSPSLSQMAEAYKGYVPPVEQGFEGQALVQPMELKHHQQPQPQPQVQYTPAKVRDENKEEDNKLLAEAYHITKEMAAREQILKENYLKAEQRSFHNEKELLLKDLRLAEFLHGKAIDEGDSELQNEMHSRQMKLQNELTRQEIDQNNFLEKYQTVLDDKPKVVEYAPSYEESDPADYESDTRKTFRKENTWYDYDSNHYNQDLVKTAADIEQGMINEYQLKNMENYLESPYYFEDLKTRLFNKYGIQMNPQQQQQAQQQAPQNPFVPAQVPQFDPQGQMPFQPQPMMQQQQQMMQSQPMQQMQQHPMQPQAMQIAPSYGPPTAPVSYGPPVSPVSYNAGMQQQPSGQGNEAMHSQKAFEMFVNSLNPTIAPQLAKLDQAQQMQLFNAAIKQQGRR